MATTAEETTMCATVDNFSSISVFYRGVFEAAEPNYSKHTTMSFSCIMKAVNCYRSTDRDSTPRGY